MSIRSKTAIEHINTMYSAYCNNQGEDYLITLIYNMLFHRGLLYAEGGLDEMRFYIEEFEYSTIPSDPAFAYEVNRIVDWIEREMEKV